MCIRDRAYATYSRGYKGPAYNVFFNMSPTQDNVLAPEKSKSYEVGLKNTLLDGRLRLNLAAFQTLSLIHISEPTRLLSISYAVFCLKKKKKKNK